MPTQALVSFIGDCTDSGALEDVLSLLCGLLQPGAPGLPQAPALVMRHLHALGGPFLVLPLLQRDTEAVRLRVCLFEV